MVTTETETNSNLSSNCLYLWIALLHASMWWRITNVNPTSKNGVKIKVKPICNLLIFSSSITRLCGTPSNLQWIVQGSGRRCVSIGWNRSPNNGHCRLLNGRQRTLGSRLDHPEQGLRRGRCVGVSPQAHKVFVVVSSYRKSYSFGFQFCNFGFESYVFGKHFDPSGDRNLHITLSPLFRQLKSIGLLGCHF